MMMMKFKFARYYEVGSGPFFIFSLSITEVNEVHITEQGN